MQGSIVWEDKKESRRRREVKRWKGRVWEDRQESRRKGVV